MWLLRRALSYLAGSSNHRSARLWSSGKCANSIEAGPVEYPTDETKSEKPCDPKTRESRVCTVAVWLTRDERVFAGVRPLERLEQCMLADRCWWTACNRDMKISRWPTIRKHGLLTKEFLIFNLFNWLLLNWHGYD